MRGHSCVEKNFVAYEIGRLVRKHKGFPRMIASAGLHSTLLYGEQYMGA